MEKDKILDILFEIVDEREIYEFAKNYAYTDEKFAEQLKKKFQKQLPSAKNAPTKAEMLKAIDRCFGHEMSRPSFDRYHSWEPEWLDWESVGKDLLRVIRQTQILAETGHAELALDVVLALLDRVGNEYQQEWDCGRDDMDWEDLHVDEMTDIIRMVFDSGEVSKERQLKVCDKLEQMDRLDAFEDSDFYTIIEDTRESLLTVEERIHIYKCHFEEAVSDYAKESAAVELWDYLIDHNRNAEAVAFYTKNKNIHRLRTQYINWLIENNELSDALLVLEEGIQQAREWPGLQLNWEECKLEVYEKMGDKDQIANQNKKLFLKGRDTMKYYKNLRQLIGSKEWPDELRTLLGKKDFGRSAISHLAEIYASEKWYDELFNLMKKAEYDLLSGLERYAKHFDADQQQTLVARLEPELRRVAEHQMGRENYKELVARLKRLQKCCPAGKQLSNQLVSDFRVKYKNRPAMIDELSKYK